MIVSAQPVAKTKVIGWVNYKLSTPAMQLEDITIITILHLLAGELRSWTKQCSRSMNPALHELSRNEGDT